MAKNTANYGNDSIRQLKDEERVRLRPAVIFGSDGLDGCAHAAFEILSNAVDEARQGYGKLKDRVSECVIETLAPLQSEHRRLMADKAYLQGVLKENAEIANRMALRTLRKVQRKVGFAERLK